ncbi:MAG: TetR/AcrR family transcriptional regulator [Gammaproteobacteria bacterium]|nr:TetR/AcrR family transcriptional regulator [Gammaproteobacteria bacterium]
MEQTNYHHGNLRSSLVSTGIEFLNQKGVAGISLREIARTIGVGHNAPYRHFRNKQQLLEAMAEDGFRRLKARYTRLELEFANDPEGQIFESAMHVISMAADQPNLFQLMFGGHIQPQDCGGNLKLAADDAMQSLVAIIRNGQRLKVFKEGDPMTLALSTMSMIQGLAIMVSSGKLKVQFQTQAKDSSWTGRQTLLRAMVLQLFDVFLRGLKRS